MKILQTSKGYLVKMSIGFDIRIEEDELDMALSIWGKEKVGKFKQGFIKGNFIAGIIEDKDREVVRDFNPETGTRYSGIRPLRDVFKDTKFLENKKQIT